MSAAEIDASAAVDGRLWRAIVRATGRVDIYDAAGTWLASGRWTGQRLVEAGVFSDVRLALEAAIRREPAVKRTP